jgi:hypothetical protein
MALVFGGNKGEDWEPTKQDYIVFFAMLFAIALAVISLKIT